MIVGLRIPAGTGLREYEKMVVMSRDEYERAYDASKTVTDLEEVTHGMQEADEV